ncbi:3-isopropylmalate dehydrogenase [Myxococcota bacterium]|nr:3-isopropylmalate dehydrogenase [Myxococcota bacterium]MBU1898542.1 3-isopropylmalate dehydrogenase [Myxococcota bacterium]
MKQRRVAVIPGDGIGPEVIEQAVETLALLSEIDALGVEVAFFDLSATRYLDAGVALPEVTFEALRDHFEAILLGALGDPRVPDMAHAEAILLGLRRRLDLYVNFRPLRLLHPRLSPLKGAPHVDIALFRENTEGLYTGAGGRLHLGQPHEVAISEMIATRYGTTRIIEAAFEWARAHGRRRVCLVDKSNAIRAAQGLWREVFEAVAPRYPEIEARHLFVDAAAAAMVLEPASFDVIVTSNLMGDILSDLGAALIGGMGVAPSANLNPSGGPALFEPVHGSAPPLAGLDQANPIAALRAVALLLGHLDAAPSAARLEAAIQACVEADEVTRDLGGALGCAAAGAAVRARLSRA